MFILTHCESKLQITWGVCVYDHCRDKMQGLHRYFDYKKLYKILNVSSKVLSTVL